MAAASPLDEQLASIKSAIHDNWKELLRASPALRGYLTPPDGARAPSHAYSSPAHARVLTFDAAASNVSSAGGSAPPALAGRGLVDARASLPSVTPFSALPEPARTHPPSQPAATPLVGGRPQLSPRRAQYAPPHTLSSSAAAPSATASTARAATPGFSHAPAELQRPAQGSASLLGSTPVRQQPVPTHGPGSDLPRPASSASLPHASASGGYATAAATQLRVPQLREATTAMTPPPQVWGDALDDDDGQLSHATPPVSGRAPLTTSATHAPTSALTTLVDQVLALQAQLASRARQIDTLADATSASLLRAAHSGVADVVPTTPAAQPGSARTVRSSASSTGAGTMLPRPASLRLSMQPKLSATPELFERHLPATMTNLPSATVLPADVDRSPLPPSTAGPHARARAHLSESMRAARSEDVRSLLEADVQRLLAHAHADQFVDPTARHDAAMAEHIAQNERRLHQRVAALLGKFTPPPTPPTSPPRAQLGVSNPAAGSPPQASHPLSAPSDSDADVPSELSWRNADQAFALDAPTHATVRATAHASAQQPPQQPTIVATQSHNELPSEMRDVPLTYHSTSITALTTPTDTPGRTPVSSSRVSATSLGSATLRGAAAGPLSPSTALTAVRVDVRQLLQAPVIAPDAIWSLEMRQFAEVSSVDGSAALPTARRQDLAPTLAARGVHETEGAGAVDVAAAQHAASVFAAHGARQAAATMAEEVEEERQHGLQSRALDEMRLTPQPASSRTSSAEGLPASDFTMAVALPALSTAHADNDHDPGTAVASRHAPPASTRPASFVNSPPGSRTPPLMPHMAASVGSMRTLSSALAEEYPLYGSSLHLTELAMQTRGSAEGQVPCVSISIMDDNDDAHDAVRTAGDGSRAAGSAREFDARSPTHLTALMSTPPPDTLRRAYDEAAAADSYHRVMPHNPLAASGAMRVSGSTSYTPKTAAAIPNTPTLVPSWMSPFHTEHQSKENERHRKRTDRVLIQEAAAAYVEAAGLSS